MATVYTLTVNAKFYFLLLFRSWRQAYFIWAAIRHMIWALTQFLVHRVVLCFAPMLKKDRSYSQNTGICTLWFIIRVIHIKKIELWHIQLVDAANGFGSSLFVMTSIIFLAWFLSHLRPYICTIWPIFCAYPKKSKVGF